MPVPINSQQSRGRMLSVRRGLRATSSVMQIAATSERRATICSEEKPSAARWRTKRPIKPQQAAAVMMYR